MNRIDVTSRLAACLGLVVALSFVAWLPGPCFAQSAGGSSLPQPPAPKEPMETRGLDVEERVGLPLPAELQFTSSRGKSVSLGEYFGEGQPPAIIVLGYYRCPVVCGVIREKLVQSLNGVDYALGKDYRVLVFSFDPGETFDAAEEHRKFDLSLYTGSQEQADAGLVYHVSDASSVRRLADALGYRYKRLDNGEYSHPVVISLISPKGVVSRYLYGFHQEPRDLKLALMEASEGKLVRSVGERFMAFCYMYDPTRGSYTVAAFRVMQVGGIVTLLMIGSLVGVLLVGERMKKRRERELKSERSELAGGSALGVRAARS